METKVNYTIIGLFVTALLTTGIVIILWLSTRIESRDYRIYLVYMNESVAGLSQNAPVKYNGVNVGFVSDIRLNLNNPQQVILTLKINPKVPITESTEAVLTEQGITGIAYIGLQGGDHAPALMAKPGQEFPVIRSVPSFLVRLDTTLQKLTTNINSLTSDVKSLFSQQNLDAVTQSLSNIEKISHTIAESRTDLGASLAQIKIFTANTAKASQAFPDLVKKIESSAKAIQSVSMKMDKTMTHGNITLQSFNNNVLPKLYDTLGSIQATSDNLQGITQELKQNPAMLIRGRKPARLGPGE